MKRAALVGAAILLVLFLVTRDRPLAVFGIGPPAGSEFILPRNLPDDRPLTLVLYQLGNSNQVGIVTDPDALAAARGEAYVITEGGIGSGFGSFTLAMMGVPMEAMFSAVFDGDTRLHALSCLSTVCGEFGQSGHDYAGLDGAAQLYTRSYESFETYDSYLARLEELRAAPTVLFLDLYEGRPLPVPRRTETVTVLMKTIAVPTAEAGDLAAITARERQRIAPLLPENITFASLSPTLLPMAWVEGLDDGEAVLVEGQKQYFDQWRFINMRLRLTGTSRMDGLPTAIFDSPDHAPEALDADFEALLRSLDLPPCEDCYGLRLSGEYLTSAFPSGSEGGYYDLEFYQEVKAE